MAEPERLKARPHHGPFPIPYVTYVDPETGIPDFKVHDNAQREKVALRGLCQLCGQSFGPAEFIGAQHVLREAMAFVGSEGSIARGSFGEPPMHPECMEFAWEVCPWLAGRDWRLDWRQAAEGLTILPEPEIDGPLGIWITRGYRTIPDLEGSGSIKWVPNPPIQPITWRSR
jgi:hypothetical protein